MEEFSINRDGLSLNSSKSASSPRNPGDTQRNTHRPPGPKITCSASRQETRPQGLSQSQRAIGSPGSAPVARGQQSGGRGGVHGWSQVAGCLPDNLQGHGGAGELGQGIG